MSYDLTKQFLVGLEVSSWKTLYIDLALGDAVRCEFVAKYAFLTDDCRKISIEAPMNDPGSILLADHDEHFLTSVAEQLRADGYACECASNSARAAEALRACCHAVLVADTNMEGNARLELVLQAQQVTRGMPVILVANRPLLETVIAAIQLPVMAYLIKPVDYPQFREHIRRLAVRSETRHTLSRTREHLNQCLRELSASVDDSVDRTKTELVSIPLLRSIAACLLDLLRLRAEIVVDGPRPRLCELLECPEFALYQDVISESIDVLEQTKSCFKSKQLASLRIRLESLFDGQPFLPGERKLYHASM